MNKSLEANINRRLQGKSSEASFKILQILNKSIIVDKKGLSRDKQSKSNRYNIASILRDYNFTSISVSIIVVYITLLCFLYLYLLSIQSEFLDWIIKLFLFLGILPICCGLYLCWDIWFKLIFNPIKETRTKGILSIADYDVEPYYQLIEDLGATFYEEDLNREEIRFRVALSDKKRISSIAKKLTPLFSILFVVVFACGLGFPTENSEINFLYGTVVGVPGIILLTRFVLDPLLEVLDSDIDIYEKCVLILQQAQDITKQEEIDAARAYDQVVASDNEVIPFEQAIAEIEQSC